MRKLGILVMAMVLVVGMSFGAMADLGDHDVDFTIDVAEYGQIDLPDETLSLNIEDLEGSNVEKEFDVTVRANTAVNTVVSMEFDNWDEVFGNRTKEDVLFGSGSSWIISPNIAYNHDGSTFHDNAGGWNHAGLDGGHEISTLGTSDNGETSDRLMFETAINEDADFHEFNADDTLEGKLIFTVTAAN